MPMLMDVVALVRFAVPRVSVRAGRPQRGRVNEWGPQQLNTCNPGWVGLGQTINMGGALPVGTCTVQVQVQGRNQRPQPPAPSPTVSSSLNTPLPISFPELLAAVNLLCFTGWAPLYVAFNGNAPKGDHLPKS